MDPFSLISSLENIFVDINNPYFASSDGVLYTKHFEELIHYPTAKTNKVYYLPNQVKVIRNQAFLFQNNLVTLIFKSEIIEIKRDSFDAMDNLRNFVFPLGVSLSSSILDRLKNYIISYYTKEIYTCPIVYKNILFYVDIHCFLFLSI